MSSNNHLSYYLNNTINNQQQQDCISMLSCAKLIKVTVLETHFPPIIDERGFTKW